MYMRDETAPISIDDFLTPGNLGHLSSSGQKTWNTTLKVMNDTFARTSSCKGSDGQARKRSHYGGAFGRAQEHGEYYRSTLRTTSPKYDIAGDPPLDTTITDV